MRVKELIKQLQTIPGNMEIFCDFWGKKDFHLWAGFKEKEISDKDYVYTVENNIEYFMKHNYNNDELKDKVIVIIPNEDEDDRED